MFELQLKGRLYLLKLIILLDFTNLNLTPKSRCKSLEKKDISLFLVTNLEIILTMSNFIYLAPHNRKYKSSLIIHSQGLRLMIISRF